MTHSITSPLDHLTTSDPLRSAVAFAALILLGLAIGLLGTLIGAGGGFILMPLLLFWFPERSPGELTAVSLAVVTLNGVSGSIGYALRKRIDYRAGLVFAVAAIPGAAVGAVVAGMLPRGTFDVVMGLALMAIAAWLMRRAVRKPPPEVHAHERPDRRRLTQGALISVGVGFFASLLGIGGGIIHVPALVYVLGFPVHTATATSHFVLALTGLTATGVHATDGSLNELWRWAVPIGIGVVIGAQGGAAWAHRVRGKTIILALGGALFLVGMRIAWVGAERVRHGGVAGSDQPPAATREPIGPDVKAGR